MGPIVGTYSLILGSYSAASIGTWAVVFVVDSVAEVQPFNDANVLAAAAATTGLFDANTKYIRLENPGDVSFLFNPSSDLILDGEVIDRFSLPAGFEARIPNQSITESFSGSPTRIFEKTATEYNNLPIGIQRNLALLYGPIGREITGAGTYRFNNFHAYNGSYSIWSLTVEFERLNHRVIVSDTGGGLSGRTWTLVDSNQVSTAVTPTSQTSTEVIFDFDSFSDGSYYLVGSGVQFASFQLGGNVTITGSGGINLGGTANIVYIADSTGIYTLVPGKLNDTIYTGLADPETLEVKIPDPFIKTAYLGES